MIQVITGIGGTTASSNIVSAARLTPGGLHLGHYIGSFSHFPLHDGLDHYFFVIENLSPPKALISPKQNRSLIDIISDILAIDSNFDIKPVLLSEIIDQSPVLLACIRELITEKQLKSIHPMRKRIRNKEVNLSLSELLFVLHEVYYILGLRGKYVLMNDDNLAFVRYANKIATKFNNVYGDDILVQPHLQHGAISRLLGHDKERMSKSGGNTIPLSISKKDLKERVNQVVMGKAGKKLLRLEGNGKFKSSSYKIPDDFLPFIYLRTFGNNSEAEAICNDFRNGQIAITELAEAVRLSIEKTLEPIQERQQYFREHPEIIFEKLEQGQEIAIETIHNVEENVIAALA